MHADRTHEISGSETGVSYYCYCYNNYYYIFIIIAQQYLQPEYLHVCQFPTP